MYGFMTSISVVYVRKLITVNWQETAEMILIW